jgi:hypothetical protein
MHHSRSGVVFEWNVTSSASMVEVGEGIVMALCSIVVCICILTTVPDCVVLAFSLVKIFMTLPDDSSVAAEPSSVAAEPSPVAAEPSLLASEHLLEECCYICVDRAADAANDDQCGHGKMMCRPCFETIKQGAYPRCPLCRAKLMMCVQIASE